MRMQYLSDLHTEFHTNMGFSKAHLFEVKGDVLVLAGDIGYLNDPAFGKLQFWKWASENYREVMIIAGNHEFYNGCDLLSFGDSRIKMFLPNVEYYHILNSAFATKLGEYIVDNKIDCWIYGHSHENIDILLGTTQVVCNQLGYVKNGEGEPGFDSGKFVVLS